MWEENRLNYRQLEKREYRLLDLNNTEGELQLNLLQCVLFITQPETILTGWFLVINIFNSLSIPPYRGDVNVI